MENVEVQHLAMGRMLTMEKKDMLNTVCCTSCGKELFQSEMAYGINVECPQCECKLKVKILKGVLSICKIADAMEYASRQ